MAVYETFDQFSEALYQAGLEKVNLIVALDFTQSNESSGRRSFNGKSLHEIKASPEIDPPKYVPVEGAQPPPYTRTLSRVLSFDEKSYEESMSIMNSMNPYQLVLSVAGQQLEKFDNDKLIPTWIFGHLRQHKEYPYVDEIHDPSHPGKTCYTIQQVLNAYEHAVHTRMLSGPTCFAPLIQKAVELCQEKEYHILLIIGDGRIDDMDETKQALKQASKVPLSIIFVGVGDGSDRNNESDPWKSMRILDDEPCGDVDNWQSVYLTDILPRLKKSPHPDVDLAVELFTEIPEQYTYFKKSGMIKQTN